MRIDMSAHAFEHCCITLTGSRCGREKRQLQTFASPCRKRRGRTGSCGHMPFVCRAQVLKARVALQMLVLAILPEFCDRNLTRPTKHRRTLQGEQPLQPQCWPQASP